MMWSLAETCHRGLASPQMESILEDLDQLSTDFERISTETEKIEDIVNGLPARVREEATLLLDSLQDRSEEMAAMNRSLNETLQNGGQTLDSLTKASQSLSQLAVQLERTSVVLDELFGSRRQSIGWRNDKDALIEVGPLGRLPRPRDRFRIWWLLLIWSESSIEWTSPSRMRVRRIVRRD